MDKTHSQPAADDQQSAADKDKHNVTGSSGLQFEETGAFVTPTATAVPEETAKVEDTPAEPDTAALDEAVSQMGLPQPEAADEPAVSVTSGGPTLPAPAIPGELDSLKKDALAELRPLVDKLELPADEKYDILLLIIRSTDDQSLLVPAHEAAKKIDDDQKRAQALLDIVKEIDYFSNQTSK